MKKLLTIMVLALALCMLCSVALAAGYYNQVLTSNDTLPAVGGKISIDGADRRVFAIDPAWNAVTGHNSEVEVTVQYYVWYDDNGTAADLTDDTHGDIGSVIVKYINDPHDYSVWVRDIVEATCAKDGSAEYQCAGCNLTLVKTISKSTVPHTYTEKTIVSKDCTKGGETGFKCAVCGAVKQDSLTKIDSADHTFDASKKECYVIIEAPACYEGSKGKVQEGVYKKLCKWCGKEVDGKYYYDMTPATYAWLIDDEHYDGHTWGEKTHFAATCFESGKYIRWCQVCDLTDTEYIVDEGKLAPKYTAITRKDGKTLYCDALVGDLQVVCAYCGGKAAGHTAALANPIERNISNGNVKYSISAADKANYPDVKDATGKHYYEYKTSQVARWENGDPKVYEATCTEAAYIEYYCAGGWYLNEEDDHATSKLYDESKPAKGHTFSDWKEVVAPKPEQGKEGMWTHYCTECGKYEEVHALVIPCKGEAHDWKVKKTVAATKDADGSIEYECSICKAKKTEVIEYVPSTAAKYEVKDAVYDGQIMTGKVNHVDDTKELDEVYARVTFFFADGTFTVNVTKVVDGEFGVACTAATVHVTVQVVDNWKQFTPPANDAIYGNGKVTITK